MQFSAFHPYVEEMNRKAVHSVAHTVVKHINKPFEEKVRTLSASSLIYDSASFEMGFYINESNKWADASA